MFFFVMTKNSNWEILTKVGLKVVSTRFLLVCFSCLKDSNCDTWENVFISLRNKNIRSFCSRENQFVAF